MKTLPNDQAIHGYADEASLRANCKNRLDYYNAYRAGATWMRERCKEILEASERSSVAENEELEEKCDHLDTWVGVDGSVNCNECGQEIA